jgi:prepilin-type N-terminal cleavage/methylation domain-containing protein
MGVLRIQRMKLSKGITLIELLVVIVVVGLLAAIAVPMYTNYTLRARRANAKTALEQLRASQEMCRAESGRYANNAFARFGGNALAALRTTWGGPDATAGDYNITMASTDTTFTGTATPSTSRQTPDGALTITVDPVNPNGLRLPADKWAK